MSTFGNAAAKLLSNVVKNAERKSFTQNELFLLNMTFTVQKVLTCVQAKHVR